MTRRSLILAATACALRADDASDVWDLFSDMAGALSDNKPDEFMSAFHRTLPGYEELRTDAFALVQAYDIQTSIELINETGDNLTRNVDLDWSMQIVEKQDTAGVVRRREVVHTRLIKQKKKWLITSFEPLSLFTPPKNGVK